MSDYRTVNRELGRAYNALRQLAPDLGYKLGELREIGRDLKFQYHDTRRLALVPTNGGPRYANLNMTTKRRHQEQSTRHARRIVTAIRKAAEKGEVRIPELQFVDREQLLSLVGQKFISTPLIMSWWHNVHQNGIAHVNDGTTHLFVCDAQHAGYNALSEAECDTYFVIGIECNTKGYGPVGEYYVIRSSTGTCVYGDTMAKAMKRFKAAMHEKATRVFSNDPTEEQEK